MRLDDFLFGSRSGIQKAVRRGDLPLAKQCFDALWGNKVHRAWLKWRIIALVQEEISYYLGELAEFLGKEEKNDDDWRKLLYELTLSLKNKDGTALLFLARRHYNKVKHPELNFILPWFKNPMVDPSVIAHDFLEKIFEVREYSLYEKEAVIMLRKRIDMGGMLGDRQNCLANMVFIAFRPLVKEEIRRAIDYRVRGYIEKNGVKIPKLTNGSLPWYVMDMHTIVGKTVLKILMKKKAREWGIKDEGSMSRLWFAFSSGYVPITETNYIGIKENPTPFESIWAVLDIKTALPSMGGKSSKEIYHWWKEVAEPEVQGIVEWLIKKRDIREEG